MTSRTCLGVSLVVCAVMGCGPGEPGAQEGVLGASPRLAQLRDRVEPALADQAPPGHGGPNPGWGGAAPPGLGHDVPPGLVGDPGTPDWKRQDAPVIADSFISNDHVVPGEGISLRVSATDPHGLPLRYLWSAPQGHLAPRIDTAAWSAPFIDEVVVVSVAVRNTLGLQVTHDFRVHVTADLRAAVFVSPGDSLQDAIDGAVAQGKTNVVIAAGTYRQALQVPSTLHLWGGYDPATWSHAPGSETVLASPSRYGLVVYGPGSARAQAKAGPTPQSGVGKTVPADGSVDGMLVSSADGGPGESSIAVVVDGIANQTYLIQGAVLKAGRGGDGLAGPSGSSGGACHGWGGAGGNFGSFGGDGSPGCDAGKARHGDGGPGGWGSVSLWPPGPGGTGGDGQDGAAGLAFSSQQTGQLTPAGPDWQAGSGMHGFAGAGGGGGGGGGSNILCVGPLRCAPSIGGNGGNGGSGGTAGEGGTGAGGSFGILIVNSSGGTLTISGLDIETKGGGNGGAGGNGGDGGQGDPGAPPFFLGGWGGMGGRGGHGGGGSGGGGGMSVGIMHPMDCTPSDGPFTNNYSLGPAGAGGEGGAHGGATGWPGLPAANTRMY